MKHLLNKLVRVTSYRGEPRNRVARIINVRDTWDKPIRNRMYKRNLIERSRWLITIHDLNDNVFRSYYHQFLTVEQVGWFGGLLRRLFQWWEDN